MEKTLEEVKEHFKNAKFVLCQWDNKQYDILETDIYFDKKFGYYFSKIKHKNISELMINQYCCAYGVEEYAKFSEIIS